MIYLDNSATTRVLPEAASAAFRAMTEQFYNPASAYKPAVAAEKAVESARARLSGALSCSPAELLYTSGGTESNNMAILGERALKSGIWRGRPNANTESGSGFGTISSDACVMPCSSSIRYGETTVA